MISCSALQQFSMAPFTVMVLSGLYRVRSWSLAGEQGNAKQWAMQDWDQVPTRDKQGQKNQLSYRASISKGCLTYLQPQVARARTGQPRTKPQTRRVAAGGPLCSSAEEVPYKQVSLFKRIERQGDYKQLARAFHWFSRDRPAHPP